MSNIQSLRIFVLIVWLVNSSNSISKYMSFFVLDKTFKEALEQIDSTIYCC